jgi:hypothetical protein
LSKLISFSVFSMVLWTMITYGDLRLGTSPAWAQADPAKVLIGTWVGHAEVPRDSERVLIISSVTPKDGGGWVADGRFGFTVKKAPPRQIEVSLQGSDIILEFVAGQNSPVRLKLVGENRLEGTLNIVLQTEPVIEVSYLRKKKGLNSCNPAAGIHAAPRRNGAPSALTSNPLP